MNDQEAPIKDHHPILGWMCRLHLTLMTAFMAAVGAKTALAAGTFVLLGLALDIARYRTVPELRMSEEQLADLMEQAAHDESVRKQSEKNLSVLAYVLLLPLIYALILSAADVWMDGDMLRSYLGLFGWLHEMVAAVAVIADRHPAELAARGYELRAPLVAHIYSVSFIAYMAVAYMSSTRWLSSNVRMASAQVRPEADGRWHFKKGKRISPIWYIIAVQLFSFLGYMAMTKWQSIKWDPPWSGRMPWSIHISDAPLIFFSFHFQAIAILWHISLLYLTYQRVSTVWWRKYIAKASDATKSRTNEVMPLLAPAPGRISPLTRKEKIAAAVGLSIAFLIFSFVWFEIGPREITWVSVPLGLIVYMFSIKGIIVGLLTVVGVIMVLAAMFYFLMRFAAKLLGWVSAIVIGTTKSE